MDTTSISLLQRLARPDEQEAWCRFVRLYTPLLFAWARRTGLQEADAADLVQEVFATLVEKLPQFHHQGQGSFRAWLHTVTLNKWRDRARRRVPHPLAGDAPPIVDQADREAAIDFEEVEYRRRLVDRALRMIQGDFQPATWQAFWQVAIDGRPAGDVAAELGLGPGAVYAARFRVIGRLRQELCGLLD